MTDGDPAIRTGDGAAGRQIFRGVTNSLGGRALTSILQFTTLVVLARGLGPAGLGEAQFAFVVFTYLILVCDPGLTVFGTREHGRASSKLLAPGTLVGARLTLSALVCVLMAASFVIASNRSPAAASVTAILAVGIVMSALSLRWLLLANHAFGVVALSELAAAGLQLAGAGLVLVLDLGSIAGLAVLVSNPVMVAALTFLRPLALGRAVRPAFDRDILRVIRLALPLGVAAVATAVYYSVDSLLLGLTRSSVEVGIYAAAYRIVLAALILPVIVHGVALPVVSKTVDAHGGAADEVIRGLSGWLMVVAIPVAATLAICAPGIVDLVYGPAFADSALPLSILIWSLVTVSANVPFAVLLLASRRDRAYLGITVLGAVQNVALNLILIPTYGYVGAAVTTVLAEVTVLGAFIWLTRPLSVRTLTRTIPLGLTPTFVLVAILAIVGGPLILRLSLAVASWGVAVFVLAKAGAMREPLAMLARRGA